MHALRRARDLSDPFGAFLRLGQQVKRVLLSAVDHRDRALQHSPNRFRVPDVHGRFPVAVFPAAYALTGLVGLRLRARQIETAQRQQHGGHSRKPPDLSLFFRLYMQPFPLPSRRRKRRFSIWFFSNKRETAVSSRLFRILPEKTASDNLFLPCCKQSLTFVRNRTKILRYDFGRKEAAE